MTDQELLTMAAVVLVGRSLTIALMALLDGQTIGPHFYNMVRWQAHRHVSRQSYTFFQNDFAGRVNSHQRINSFFGYTGCCCPCRYRSFFTTGTGRPVIHKYMYGIAVHNTFYI